MEWCQHGDLARHIARTREANARFADAEIQRWFTQLASALEYMHARRVLHRDLKSSACSGTRRGCDADDAGNVFLTLEKDAKLGDLGIAKILESTMAEADSVVGTPQYLSPELCENRPYSYSSDVWALGCVLYELCALKRPFDASNLLGVVYCVVKGDADMSAIADRSTDLQVLVTNLLIKDATRRPNAKAVVARLRRVDLDDDCYQSDFDSDDSAEDDRRGAREQPEQQPTKKTFASVSATTTPPRAAATSGFLLESASSRRSKRPTTTAKSKPDKDKPKPAVPFARTGRRALEAAKRKLKLDLDGDTSSRSYSHRSTRTSRSTFGSDSENSPTTRRTRRPVSAIKMAPPQRRPTRRFSFGSDDGDELPSRRHTFDDLPEPPGRRRPSLEDRPQARPHIDDLAIRPHAPRSALDSADAARIRARLGDDTFFAICDVFRDAYDRGASVNRRDLLTIVRTQERYLDCVEVERFIFQEYEEHAARRQQPRSALLRS